MDRQNNNEIFELKKRVLLIGQKHRQIISKLKNDLKTVLEKSAKISATAKIKIQTLTISLAKEKENNSQLKEQLDQLKKVGDNSEFLSLKMKLQEEIAKSEVLTRMLQEARNNPSVIQVPGPHTSHLAETSKENDIQSIRDIALANAKLKRMEVELESTRKLLTDSESKIYNLEQELGKEITKSEKEATNAEQQINELQQELNSKMSTAEKKNKELLKEIRRLIKEVKTLENSNSQNQTIIDQKDSQISSLQEELSKFSNTIKQNETEYKEIIKLKDKEIDRLNDIVNRFDLVKVENSLNKIKEESLNLIKKGEQNSIKKALERAVILRQQAAQLVDDVKERTLNYHQEIDEIEQSLRNNIVRD